MNSLPPELVEKLRDMGRTASQPQKAWAESVAKRSNEPLRRETLVDDLEEFGERRIDAVSFFKRIAQAGGGRFLAGRRKAKSRIKWTYSAIEIAKQILQGAEGAIITSSAGPSDEIANGSIVGAMITERGRPSCEWHTHSFLVRPGVSVELKLPLDITGAEANRLAEFVKAIPFVDAN